MIIARKLRQQNLAEYLLYMWQVEDILRAFHTDADTIAEQYLSRFQLKDEKTMQEMKQWYADLCRMMHEEGVTEHGHLQICQNVLIQLKDTHSFAMKCGKHPAYAAAYHRILPFIVELRAKNKQAQDTSNPSELSKSSPASLPEIDTAFEFLYGIMLCRLQHREITQPTQDAANQLSHWLGMLSELFFRQKEHPEQFED